MTSTTVGRFLVGRIGRAAVIPVWLIMAGVLWSAAGYPEVAVASCAQIRITSAHSFTGVVLDTRSQGRVATVRTDTGVTVEVVGTPSVGSVMTSVDRTYEVGARYEFHPLNSTSPYQDNACTATRLLSPAAGPTSGPGTGGNGLARIGIAAAGLLTLGAAGALIAIRHKRSLGSSVPTAPGQRASSRFGQGRLSRGQPSDRDPKR